jgi:hypothetical protein
VRQRPFFGLIGVSLAGVLLWGSSTALANQRRDDAVARLQATVSAAADGEVLDLREAFGLSWDRAVVVGPYSPGSVPNDALGFDHYPPTEVITQGDGTSLLVFARDRTFVADFALYPQGLHFDEAVFRFDADSARFRVVRGEAGVVLTPIP